MPFWADHRRWTRTRLPPALRAWLLDSGSLTERLIRSCSGEFRVRVVGEGWQRPRLDEARVLGMPLHLRARIRQVQLLCDGVPWVFARTVIPVSTLGGERLRLLRLGDRPLGAYLFADPRMSRGPVELARIRPRQAMYAEAMADYGDGRDEIWGRRSVFRLAGRPLLVTEVFLPAIGAPS